MKKYRDIIEKHMEGLLKGKDVRRSNIGTEICVKDMSSFHTIGEHTFNDAEKFYIYKHYMFSTKKYRDPACAVFKLLKFVEAFLDKSTFVFIRHYPAIDRVYDYEKNIEGYRGYFRASTDRTMVERRRL